MGTASSQLWTKGTNPGIAPGGKVRLFIDDQGRYTMVDDTGTEQILGSTSMSSDIDDLKNIVADTGEPNGFVLSDPLSMGEVSFNDSLRTFVIEPATGQSEFIFYCNGVKFSKTVAESVVLPDVSGLYYIYYDNDALLTYTTAPNELLFTQYAIVSIIYWNSDQAYATITSEERHGISMSGTTHMLLHITVGARYDKRHLGLDLVGGGIGVTNYTSISKGIIWDEDISHTVAEATEHSFLFMKGQGYWCKGGLSSSFGYFNGNVVYNEYTGSEWVLTPLNTDEFACIHFVTCPGYSGGYVYKIVGQNKYTSRRLAREGIMTEIGSLNLVGLPSPEIVYLYSVVLNSAGEVQEISGGAYYVDFRFKYGAGKDGHIPGVTSHTDLTEENTLLMTTVSGNYVLTWDDRVIVQQEANSIITLPHTDDLPDDGYIRSFWVNNASTGSTTIKLTSPDTFPAGNDKVVLTTLNESVQLGAIHSQGYGGWSLSSRHKAIVQIRRDSAWDASNFDNEAAVPFTVTDQETNDSVVYFDDVNKDRIIFNVNATIVVSYWLYVDSTGGGTYTASTRLVKNGNIELLGSKCVTGNYGGEDQSISIGFIYHQVSPGDYIQLFASQNNLTGNINNVVLSGSVEV